MTSPSDSIPTAYPVGVCYCGCGTKLEDPRAFFVRSHDRKAEARVIREVYGSVANFLLAHDRAPVQAQAQRPARRPRREG